MSIIAQFTSAEPSYPSNEVETSDPLLEVVGLSVPLIQWRFKLVGFSRVLALAIQFKESTETVE